MSANGCRTLAESVIGSRRQFINPNARQETLGFLHIINKALQFLRSNAVFNLNTLCLLKGFTYVIVTWSWFVRVFHDLIRATDFRVVDSRILKVWINTILGKQEL
jgi:hypothetical protein